MMLVAMRVCTLRVAVLVLVGAAHAQNVQSPSDSFLCNHGVQSDSATQQACAKLRGAGGVSAQPPPTQENTGSNSMALPSVAPAATPAPPPTDIGEAPANEVGQATNSQDVDEDATHISVRAPWLGLLGGATMVAIILGLMCGLALYFLPTIIAFSRGKRNAIAIFVLNLFLGWSFIGWVIALVWSLTGEPSI